MPEASNSHERDVSLERSEVSASDGRVGAQSGSDSQLPPSTRDQVIERGTDDGPDPRDIIRFSPSHGNEWPLWDEISGSPISPEELELSPDLVARLRVWMDEWLDAANLTLRELRPYDPYVLEERWFKEGALLADLIADEIGHRSDLVVSFEEGASNK